MSRSHLPRPPACGRGQSGFTLLEAAVALSITAIALFLAASLLDDTRRMLDAAKRDASDPLPRFAIVNLQKDLSEAGAIVSPSLPGLWDDSPLEVVASPSRRLRYLLDSGRLVRQELDATGALIQERPLLQGVARWRWRQVGGDLVDIELSYHRTRLSLTGRNPRDSSARGAARPTVDRFRVALRGVGRGNVW